MKVTAFHRAHQATCTEVVQVMTLGNVAIFMPADVLRPGCTVVQPLAFRKALVNVRVALLSCCKA